LCLGKLMAAPLRGRGACQSEERCAFPDRAQPQAKLQSPPNIRLLAARLVCGHRHRTLAPYSAPVFPYFWKMAVSTSAAASAGSWPARSSTGTCAKPVTSSTRTCTNTARQQAHPHHPLEPTLITS
jgi:hypothetical protein